MKRILIVVNERKSVRDKYRIQLEQEYIKKQKEQQGVTHTSDPDEGLYNRFDSTPSYKEEIDRIYEEKKRTILDDPDKQSPLTR